MAWWWRWRFSVILKVTNERVENGVELLLVRSVDE